MKDYWEVNDRVVSSLDRPLENKKDKELIEDYKNLKNAPSTSKFSSYYIDFSIFPAVFSLITTISIALFRPEYIQIIIDHLGYQVNIPNEILGIGLSIFNFIFTFIGLSNVVSFGLNKSVTGNPTRHLHRRHLENLAKNSNRYNDIINEYKLINPQTSNPIIKAALRNFKMEPIGTNIIYDYVLNLHEREIEKRGISKEKIENNSNIKY